MSASPHRTPPPTSSRTPSPVPSPGRALALAGAALLLELILVLPIFDRLAEKNATVHFTQHGGIFLGGVLMGVALRDMYRASRA